MQKSSAFHRAKIVSILVGLDLMAVTRRNLEAMTHYVQLFKARNRSAAAEQMFSFGLAITI